MARRRKRVTAYFRRVVAPGLCPLLLAISAFSQQPGIQSNFFPGVARTSAASSALSISDTERISYLTAVTRENQGNSVFQGRKQSDGSERSIAVRKA